jgi:hypothetical protein
MIYGVGCSPRLVQPWNRSRDSLPSAAELILELDHEEVSAFEDALSNKRPSPLAWLDAQRAPWRHALAPADAERQHRYRWRPQRKDW